MFEIASLLDRCWQRCDVCLLKVEELIIRKEPSLLDNFLDVSH